MNSPTYEDLQRLIESTGDEGLHLEFKDIRAIYPKLNSASLTAAVSAFANSDGGDLIVGVSGTKSKDGFFLSGQNGGGDLKDTLERVIESNTSPPVASYVVQSILSNEGHRFYWIRVERSASAPHQNQENIYYKRNGSSSKPMEHYEVEDVRARKIESEYPIDVKVEVSQGVLAELTIRNRGNRVVEDTRFEIRSNLPIKTQTVARLQESGIKWLHPGNSATFYLGELRSFLQKQTADLQVDFDYIFAGIRRRDSRKFDFQDFNLQAVKTSEVSDRLKKIEKALADLGQPLKKMSEYLETISSGFSSSGLHLAASTVGALSKTPDHRRRKYDITQADVEGLRDVLGIDREQAYEIYRNFAFVGQQRVWRDFYSALPAELQQKINDNFEIPVTQNE